MAGQRTPYGPYRLAMSPRSRDDERLAGAEIAVVGAGFDGLSAAAHLADAGADVTVFERNEHPGGYAGRIERDGFRIDTSPSWYLMRRCSTASRSRVGCVTT